MTTPKVRQIVRPIPLPDNVFKYEVISEIIDKGDLPFPHLFVLNIVDNADPKQDVFAHVATPAEIRQADPNSPIYVKVISNEVIYLQPDTFARIANISEITKLPRDRVIATRQGFTNYLTTAFSAIYDALPTADAAARQIISRLSELVVAWREAQQTFIIEPYKDYELPVASVSVEDQLKALYEDQKAIRISLEKTRDAIEQEKIKCEQDCIANKTIYNFLIQDVAFLTRARNVVIGLNNTGLTYDFVLQLNTFSGNPESYQQLLIDKNSSLLVYAEQVRACDNKCATLNTQLLAANQQVDTARQAEQVALNNVLIVCPSFDPNMV